MELIPVVVQHGHREFGEDSATIELPLLLLFQQKRTDQASDGGVVEEESDDASAAFDFFLMRSNSFVLQIVCQCSLGMLRKTSMSPLAFSIKDAAAGNFSLSIAIT